MEVGEHDDNHDLQKLAAEQQEKSLIPLKEDLAEWLKKLLDIDITVNNFIDVLDNGVYVCQLANLICDKANKCQQEGLEPKDSQMPKHKIKFKGNAQSGTWFARDNTANFLQWCRDYGVMEEYLFETEGLVLHKQQRSVVLCLLELARIGLKFGLEPPTLVKLEKEIDGEIEKENGDGEAIEYKLKNVIIEEIQNDTSSMRPSSAEYRNDGAGDVTSAKSDFENVAVRKKRAQSVGSIIQSESRRNSAPSVSDKNVSTPVKPKQSELDREVKKYAGQCRCEHLFEIERIREGTYRVGGKIVFIRLLKGKHLMVRVGGGWDTLEHFLSRHDPCRIIEHKRGMSQSCDSLNDQEQLNYLVVQGKYKGHKK